ncbi:hypothetical protein UJ101_00497 [Flavobacteriaceae bacterium UJ101]|nr:hypothetical protein UJ101_00497 [Flavobacteriaceae bacterium UJ101]
MFKKIIIIIGIVLLGNWAKAQDPGVSDVVITPGVVESGGNATFSFNLYNASSTGLTTWSSGDSFALQVIVSLSDAVPSDTSTISNSITGTWSGKFDWSYDSGSNTITGIQKEDIAGETLTVPSAGSIEIAVENTAESAQSDPNCGFIVNLTPPATAVSMNLDDDSKNIYTYTEVVVTTCSKSPLTTGTPEVTKAGISTLSQTPTDNWPLDVNNGFIVLESTNKGFVVTRHTTAELSNIENPIEGMLIYDTTAKCLKLYKNGAWTCVKKSCN